VTRTLLLAALAAAALGGAVLAAPAITTLPTGWRIVGPDGPVATVGTLPEGLALSPDGTRLVEVEAGHQPPALRVFDAASLHELRTVKLNGAFGVPLRDPDGAGVWVNVAGDFQEQIAHVDIATGTIDRDVSLPLPFFPVALARSPDGNLLAVAGDLGGRVAFIDPSAERVVRTVRVGLHPAALAFAPDGSALYVAERGERAVDVVPVPGTPHFVVSPVRPPAYGEGDDDDAPRPLSGVTRIPVGLHPDALALDGDRLFVADADDDDVAIVDRHAQRVIARVPLPFHEPGVFGDSPNAMTLDGDRLYVSCGAANAIAVFRVTPQGLTPLGAIPTGWYPTAVAVDRAHGVLYVADGKGESSHANPKFDPLHGGRVDYIADNIVGSIRRLPIPDDAALAQGLTTVRELAQHASIPPSPIVRANGPIRHVLYVIKENRSYDEVLGDLRPGDGDASLVLFGAAITPNQHAIERRFGTFDRFFEDAHVSADGHNWSTAAFANDYLEKMWPQDYANRGRPYDFEDAAEPSVPHAGYLWDDAVAHGVTLRNYGEFVTSGPSAPTPVSVSDDVLRTRTDRNFATFDLDVADADRFIEWKHEFDAYERSGTLPALEIVRFPDDHTAGTKPGALTPQAMVADNDGAVGALVAAISHSPDWAHTAVFVIEDDAQNGPDHVDEQRSTFYLASPYARGGVQHEAYSQASVLRTIEIILGLPPMSTYDAGAPPLSAAFTDRPDMRPFDARPEMTDVHAKNAKTAYRAADSARFDLAEEDRVDDATFNDILWHAVKGARATPPPYGAFSR
jgi:DNA-binding beta-propeller fold protein YncE